MSKRQLLNGMLLAVMLLGMQPFFSLAAPNPSQLAQEEGPNLLQNPGFEADWGIEQSNRCMVFPVGGSPHEKIKGNVFTPPGWVTWFRHDPGTWDEPEVTDTAENPDPRRTRSGARAMRFFTFWRDHDGGFYQVVEGLEPGTKVKFSAYAEGWSCDEVNENATSCGDEWSMFFRVGIEPNGAVNPFSPNMVWSAKTLSHNNYGLIGPVEAVVGESGKVVVFLRSKTKWAYKHQDAYWDDAKLVALGPSATPTSTPLPPPPTATPGPSPTPLPTPTPRPDGAIVHIVEPGDTLFGIAYTYDVPVDQLRELNAGSLGPNDLLSVGQAVVISVPENAPTPTPLPQTPTATPGVQPTASPEPEGESDPGEGSEGGEGSGGAEGGNSEGGAGGNPGGAYICVASFHDRNGDTFRDPETEELLPNTEFKIANASGVVEQYTTDGVSEPYCFNELEPGSYRVIQSAPPGYEPNGLPEQNVALAEGTGFEFQFGNVRSEEANNPSESDEPASPENENGNENNGANGGSTFGRVLSTAAKVAGVLVLMLAAAIAVLFVLSRRQRY